MRYGCDWTSDEAGPSISRQSPAEHEEGSAVPDAKHNRHWVVDNSERDDVMRTFLHKVL